MIWAQMNKKDLHTMVWVWAFVGVHNPSFLLLFIPLTDGLTSLSPPTTAGTPYCRGRPNGGRSAAAVVGKRAESTLRSIMAFHFKLRPNVRA